MVQTKVLTFPVPFLVPALHRFTLVLALMLMLAYVQASLSSEFEMKSTPTLSKGYK